MTLLVLFGMLTICVPAAAQSEVELFGGFSYVRAETAPYLQPEGLDHINAIGWDATASEYPWRWFGATLDVSGVYENPAITDPSTGKVYNNFLHTSAYTVMFGPSFAYRRNPKIEPFVHVLLGSVHADAALTSKGEYLLGSSAGYSNWTFGYALGGGIDFKVTKLVAIRGQGDWIRSTFKNFNNDRENTSKVAVGLVFRFGGTSSSSPARHAPPSGGSQPPVTPKDEASNVATEPSVQVAAATPASMPQQTPPVVAKTATPIPAPDAAVQPGGAVPHAALLPPVIAPMQPPHNPPVQQADVAFWSRPAGADVLLDGVYVGITPATIAVPAGEHTITIRKQDFQTWQKTIKVTSGNVRVEAYMEQVRYTLHFDH